MKNKMTFKDIFEQYWVIYRGQATSIPFQLNDREYSLGIRNCNAAIKAWERADGQLWRELRSTLQSQTGNDSGEKTITNGKILYDAPGNMRKPPGRVFAYGNNQYHELHVIDPKDLAKLNELSSAVCFIGSANKGYQMQTSERVAEELNGKNLDYVYDTAAQLLSTTEQPAEVKLEMSDPSFAVYYMLKLRSAANSNGFMFRFAESEASVALMNMKIENENGTWENPDVLALEGKWGTPNTTEMTL